MATAFPPTHTHSTQRVSLSQAHILLSTYLRKAAMDSSLHPNALLTEDGSTNPSGGQMGLTMHSLQRVEAGLRGEYLGADLELEEKKKGKVEEVVGGVDSDTMVVNPSVGKVGEIDVEMQNEWQDRGEFEREQEDLQGEIGERVHAGPDGVGVPRVGRGDKEGRKRAKVERRKREKREKEELLRRIEREREAEDD